MTATGLTVDGSDSSAVAAVAQARNRMASAPRSPRPGPLHVSVRPFSEVGRGEIAAWRELARRALEPNPFFEPGFLAPAARWLAAERVGLLVAEDGDGWAACLPVRTAPTWRSLPLPLLAGWRHPFSYLGTPLVDAERPHEALGSLVARPVRGRYLGIVLNWVAVDGPVSSVLGEVLEEGRLGVAVYHSFERALLTRRSATGYLCDGLSARRRKELRRLDRRLGEELGAPVEVLDRGDEVGSAADFAALEAAGWKGEEGTALASTGRGARFFEEVCDSFSAAGRLELLSLEAGGRKVAMQCNLIAGDGTFCFKVAYDESLARFSPGVQLELRAIEAFHERHETAWMDSCADPRNELMNRLWLDRRRIASLAVAPQSARGRALLAAVRAGARRRERDWSQGQEGLASAL